MDIKSVSEVAKKNVLSIVCGVLALIAVIATLTVIVSQKASVQKALDARKDTYGKIAAVLEKTRHKPVVSLDPDAPPEELGRFPNRIVIDAGEQAIKRVADQSLQIKTLAVSMNAHELLVPNSLPTSLDPFRFQKTYLQQFETVFPKTLNSVTPPTTTEIDAEISRRAEKITREAPHDAATGEVYNKEAVDQSINRMSAELPEQMRQDAAMKHKMYMSSDALRVLPEMAGRNGATVAPGPEQIWLAQMGLWIQGDVAAAIADLNKASTNVDGSTVKQLADVDIPSTLAEMYVLPAIGAGTPPAAAGGAAASAVAANTETDPLPKDYSVSPTGRVCNGVFDVVHFTVVVDVRAADVEKVIQEFERDRLLTVYQTEVVAVNSAVMQQAGYYFGKSPVVTLTLKCEELFLRDWTRKFMPESVKKYLNVQEPAAAQPVQPTASTN